MDFHVIAPGAPPDLVARVVDGQLVIVPPENFAPQTEESTENAGQETSSI